MQYNTGKNDFIIRQKKLSQITSPPSTIINYYKVPTRFKSPDIQDIHASQYILHSKPACARGVHYRCALPWRPNDQYTPSARVPTHRTGARRYSL